MESKSIYILSGIAVILVIAMLFFTPFFGMEVFPTSKCDEYSYSKTFTSYNIDGYAYKQTLKATAKICFPEMLPVWPTEGDVVQMTCNGRGLYIDTTADTCNELGCSGTKVTSPYDYVIKPGQTQLNAVCWAKTIDEDVNDEKIWVWAAQDIQFSFDGVKPLQVTDPTAVCGDGFCNLGETCENCQFDCEPFLQILTNPRVYLGCNENTACGDGFCDEAAGEACDMCTPDCGNCATDWCGDGKCQSDETFNTCPEDCELVVVCGDGTCNGDETCTSCEGDCGKCPVPPPKPINWPMIVLIGMGGLIVLLVIVLLVIKKKR